MDERIGQGLAVVIAVTVVGLLIAFLMPVVIGQFNGTMAETYGQTEGETTQLTGNLNGTLDAADLTTGINVTVMDGANSASITELAEGNNETVQIDGEDITVYNRNVTSATNATVEYEWPNTYGWDGGTVAMFTILPLLLILTVFLFVAFIGIKAYQEAN